MNSSAASKWQVRLAVVLIFVVGFIAGALAMNVYRSRQRAFSRANGHGRFEQVLDKLNLSPEQRTQVGAIFDDARAQLTEVRKESGPKFREVRERTDERLKAVLTPEQWEQFQQVTNESRERRQHRRGRDSRR
ncbi:MAG TPA: periplasmic heavy metal sensor [Blastocatellia bacterium]|nr:periplasmic heavy metal sensor [Blastocatellia bacterium]